MFPPALIVAFASLAFFLSPVTSLPLHMAMRGSNVTNGGLGVEEGSGSAATRWLAYLSALLALIVGLILQYGHPPIVRWLRNLTGIWREANSLTERLKGIDAKLDEVKTSQAGLEEGLNDLKTGQENIVLKLNSLQ